MKQNSIKKLLLSFNSENRSLANNLLIKDFISNVDIPVAKYLAKIIAITDSLNCENEIDDYLDKFYKTICNLSSIKIELAENPDNDIIISCDSPEIKKLNINNILRDYFLFIENKNLKMPAFTDLDYEIYIYSDLFFNKKYILYLYYNIEFLDLSKEKSKIKLHNLLGSSLNFPSFKTMDTQIFKDAFQQLKEDIIKKVYQ